MVWGNNHTLALTNQGEVFSWGMNNKGCLGFSQDSDLRTPKKIPLDSTGMKFNSIKDIAWGGFHNLALSEENRTFSWGNGDNGRLGHGTKRSEAIPKEIIMLKIIQPKYIYWGDSHSACISMKSRFYSWGKGSYGRLGHGFTDDVYDPKVVDEIFYKSINDAFLGVYHTFIITKELDLYAWGAWNFGKLGIRGKTSGNLILPTFVPKFSMNIVEISAAPSHTLALNSKGKIFSWGNGSHGKLGNKNWVSTETPTIMRFSEKFGNIVIKIK